MIPGPQVGKVDRMSIEAASYALFIAAIGQAGASAVSDLPLIAPECAAEASINAGLVAQGLEIGMTGTDSIGRIVHVWRPQSLLAGGGATNVRFVVTIGDGTKACRLVSASAPAGSEGQGQESAKELEALEQQAEALEGTDQAP